MTVVFKVKKSSVEILAIWRGSHKCQQLHLCLKLLVTAVIITVMTDKIANTFEFTSQPT